MDTMQTTNAVEMPNKRLRMEGEREEREENEKETNGNVDALTSIRVFRMFFKRVINQQTGRVELDASDILSPVCYNTWLSKRRTRPQNPEKSFQRSLSAHVTGTLLYYYYYYYY